MASSSRNQTKHSTVAFFCGPVLPSSIPRSPSPRYRSPVSSSWSERLSKEGKNCMSCPSNHPRRRGLGHQKTTRLPKRTSSVDLRKLAIKNCLVKMGGMVAEVAKKTLIFQRPSPFDKPPRRLAVFKLKPSRLSFMSKAEDRRNARMMHQQLSATRVNINVNAETHADWVVFTNEG